MMLNVKRSRRGEEILNQIHTLDPVIALLETEPTELTSRCANLSNVVRRAH